MPRSSPHARKRVVLAEEYVQWAQEWKVECEKELSEAKEGLARLRLEVERPAVTVPGPSNGGQCQTAGSAAKRPRDEKISCVHMPREVIEWMRSADGHPRGDREGQCGRGGQVVDLGGPRSVVAQHVPAPVSSSGSVGSAMIQ